MNSIKRRSNLKDWQNATIMAIHSYRGLTAEQIQYELEREQYKVSLSQIYRFLGKVEGLKAYQVQNGSKLKLYSFNYIHAGKRLDIYRLNEFRKQCRMPFLNRPYEEWTFILQFSKIIRASGLSDYEKQQAILYTDNFVNATKYHLKAIDELNVGKKDNKPQEGTIYQRRNTDSAITMADSGVYLMQIGVTDKGNPILSWVLFDRSSMSNKSLRDKFEYVYNVERSMQMNFIITVIGDNMELFKYKSRALRTDIEKGNYNNAVLQYWNLNDGTHKAIYKKPQKQAGKK